MIVIDCIQQSEEWYMRRLGIPTSSGFSMIVQSELDSKSITNTNKKADKAVVVHINNGIVDIQTHKPVEGGAYTEIKSGETKTVTEEDIFLLRTGAGLIVIGGCKPSKSRDGYIAQLITECKCNAPADWVGNDHTQRGNDLEPEAREAYEYINDCNVEQVGFCLTDDEHFGCSPDGLIDNRKGGIEIKCPELKVHIEYMMKNRLPPTYAVQVHGCMHVTGCDYWDFMSYCQGEEPLILRIERDEFTEKLGKALDDFYVELQKARERFGVSV